MSTGPNRARSAPGSAAPSDSIVMLFAGEGWGKSSSALGYTMRAAGRGWPTTVIQFVKGAAWNSAEASIGALADMNWPVFTSGLSWGAKDPQQLCEAAWAAASEALSSEEPGLVVLDEVTHAVEHGWLSAETIAAAVEARNPLTSVIMTGREAPEELVAVSDTVTAFELVKHTHRAGILAP